jgi:hypothetical protein
MHRQQKQKSYVQHFPVNYMFVLIYQGMDNYASIYFPEVYTSQTLDMRELYRGGF